MKVLSGGAAAAVVRAVEQEFQQRSGQTVEGSFSAVGAMRDSLLAGTPCDLVILTPPLIEQLVASGHVRAGSARSLGRVHTAVAVPAGRPHPDIATPEQLAAALNAASAIYCPDLQKSTAGIHFMRVLQSLGLDQRCAAALRPFPNGATAMAAMARAAEAGESGAIGCTQATEINYTPGVELVGVLPPAFELATDYMLGICSQCADPAAAELLAGLLAGPASEPVRRQGGFQF
jgi:molybdate transport system substrate-binding protein